jgi:hypothetical protein
VKELIKLTTNYLGLFVRDIEECERIKTQLEGLFSEWLDEITQK